MYMLRLGEGELEYTHDMIVNAVWYRYVSSNYRYVAHVSKVTMYGSNARQIVTVRNN